MRDNKNIEDLFIKLSEFKTANDMISDELNKLRKTYENESDEAFRYSFKNVLVRIELLNDWTNDKLVSTLKNK